jgi:predicted metalloprotease
VTQGCPEGDQACEFTSAILKGTEDVWSAEFARRGGQYQPPKLISFDRVMPTACGTGQAAMGPFYCPGDRTVYIDTSFYDELGGRFGAAGDFANAYVIAHEVGHHVQTLTGASDQVAAVRRRGDQRAANQASVRLELQADCYAGMWAAQANQLNIQRNGRPLLEPGEEAEALRAASAIGDDRLQQQSQGRVAPDSFTHGSSEQRVRWFQRGFQTGDMDQCDTFSARTL